MRYHSLAPPNDLGVPGTRRVDVMRPRWAWECVGPDPEIGTAGIQGLYAWPHNYCIDGNFKLFLKAHPGHEGCGWVRRKETNGKE